MLNQRGADRAVVDACRKQVREWLELLGPVADWVNHNDISWPYLKKYSFRGFHRNLEGFCRDWWFMTRWYRILQGFYKIFRRIPIQIRRGLDGLKNGMLLLEVAHEHTLRDSHGKCLSEPWWNSRRVMTNHDSFDSDLWSQSCNCLLASPCRPPKFKHLRDG